MGRSRPRHRLGRQRPDRHRARLVEPAPRRPPAGGAVAVGVRFWSLLVAVGFVATFVAWQVHAAQEFAAVVYQPDQLGWFVVFSIGPYLAIVASSLLIAVAGRPALAVLPPIAFVVVGWSASGSVGAVVLGQWPTGLNVALAISFGLALAPSLAFAFAIGRGSVPRPDAIGLATAAGLVVIVIVVRGVLTGFEWDSSIESVAVAVLVGACVAHRPWLLVPAVVVASALFADPLAWLASGFDGRVPTQALVLAAAAVLAGASHRRVSAAIAALRRSPTRLVVAFNALNVADAVATALAVESGRGEEANPIVGWIGLPAKVLLGLAFSLAIARHRARALVAPIVVLALVLVWHLAGLLVI